jgi:hypothetical protein
MRLETTRRALAGSALLGVTLLLAACGSSSHTSSSAAAAAGVSGPSEVRAEAVSTGTKNPFTATVGMDKKGIKPPAAAATTQRPTFTGSLPGLYGGTRNYATCDAGKLIGFLEENHAKAVAWSQSLGIRDTDIRHYVSGLTAVLLRTDTRVTNHGYVNGVANPIQSVLEAGTAVFVDHYGEPVVKCYCGNPLGPPQLLTAPRYYGPIWTGFKPASLTVINQSTTIINLFTLYDPNTGQLFSRKPGLWTPHSDGPYKPHGSGTATSPNQGGQPAPAQPALNPAAAFSPSSGTVLDSFSISATGFPPNTSLTMNLTRPDGGVESYPLTTNSSGSATFAFPHVNNPLPGTYTANISDGHGHAASSSLNVAPAPGSGGGGSGPSTSSTDTTSSSTDTTSSTDTLTSTS